MSEETSIDSQTARKFVWSNALQNTADQLVAGKTVLPWLFEMAGVGAFYTALLVPIRESGSMLPQAVLAQWMNNHSRKKLWLLGSALQALCALIIAAASFLSDAPFLGPIVIVALAILALSRCLCSLAGKDLQGQLFEKGTRGRITGAAAQLGGAGTLIAGGILWFMGQLSRGQVALVVLAGAVCWACATANFAAIATSESAELEASGAGDSNDWWTSTWQLYTQDRAFREFVHVRSLMLVSALSGSFIVLLAGASLKGLAGFVLASGLSGLVAGKISGLWSDRSSRLVMSWAAAVASAVCVAVVILANHTWALVGGFFLLNLAHTAIRVARKTYIVDMSGDAARTQYIGSANTLMGVILLIVGAISSVIAVAGPKPALIFLAVIGLIGTWRARMLPEVSAAG